MRRMTVGLGLLTALLAASLAVPRGYALLDSRTEFRGPAQAVIRDPLPAARGGDAASSRFAQIADGIEPGVLAQVRPSDAPSSSSFLNASGAPSMGPIPALRAAAGRRQGGVESMVPLPGAEDDQPGLEQAAKITYILLNLPQVVSTPPAPPSPR